MLLKIGFKYKEALTMPKGAAIEYLDAYNELKNPKSKGTAKKYVVQRKK